MKITQVTSNRYPKQNTQIRNDCEYLIDLEKALQKYGSESGTFQDKVKSYIDWTKRHRCSFPNNRWMRFTQKLKKCNFALTDELLDLIHTRVSEYTFQKSIENQLTFLE